VAAEENKAIFRRYIEEVPNQGNLEVAVEDLRPLRLPPVRRVDARAWPRGRKAVHRGVSLGLPRLPHQH
jgi:hypothetical protein